MNFINEFLYIIICIIAATTMYKCRHDYKTKEYWIILSCMAFSYYLGIKS